MSRRSRSRQLGIRRSRHRQGYAHCRVFGVGPWFYAAASAHVVPLPRQAYDIHLSWRWPTRATSQPSYHQRNYVPSMYARLSSRPATGLQHWSSWPVDYTSNLDRAPQDRLDDRPAGESARGRSSISSTRAHPGTVIELPRPRPTSFAS